jgi:hypothetical protein
MFRYLLLPRAALCLALAYPALLAAQIESHWYQPHDLSGVEDASDRLQLLSSHLAPVTIKGERFFPERGYSLQRADVNKFGILLGFRKSGAVLGGRYHWSWGSGYNPSIYTPQKDDLVTSIVFRDISYFQIWKVPMGRGQAGWCVVPMDGHIGRNNVLCVGTKEDAQALVDALATLVEASGGSLSSPFGMWAKPRMNKDGGVRRGKTGWQITQVDVDGPPAQAGIRIGDLLYSVNGFPCTGEGDFLNAFRDAASGGTDGGDLPVELLRKGKQVILDLHYASGEGAEKQLTQKQTEGSLRNASSATLYIPPAPAALTVPVPAPVATVVPAPAPVATVMPAPASALLPVPADISVPVSALAPSGFRLGIQVRAVTEADAVAFRLSIPRGIVVLYVEKGSLADAMQMQSGDVILEVNGSEIGDVQLFTQTIRRGAARTFRVWHNGQSVKNVVPESL